MEQNKMTTTAGIKPLSTINYSLIGEIKQTILLFDTVGIPQLDMAIRLIREKHKHNCIHHQVSNELEFLKEKGFLFNSWGNEAATPLKKILT